MPTISKPAGKTKHSGSAKGTKSTPEKLYLDDISKNRRNGAEKRMAELHSKRKRQYEHVLDSEKKEGRNTKTAKRIAMATVNKTRRKKGETKKSSQ